MSLEVLWIAGLVALLIALDGVFVSGEFALLGAPRSRLEPLARAGRRDARHVLELSGSLRALDRSLTTAQIGITLVSLGLGMYGEHAVAELLRAPLQDAFGWSEARVHVVASTAALAGLTYLHIVLGETLPKAVALQYPVRTALWMQLPLRWTRRLLAPLIFFMDLCSNTVLRLLRVPVDHQGERPHTQEEIESIIEEGGSGGVLGPRQAELLLNLLDFQDLAVRKLMVPRTRVVGFEVGTGFDETLRVIRETGFTRYPVFEHDLDHVVGFVHARDLMRVGDGAFDLRSLVRQAPMIPEAASAGHLLHALREARVPLAIVIDEHGGTAGIATLEDLVEEIFGEVQDEFDAREFRIRNLGNGAFLADAALRVDEINQELDLALPEGDVDTLGGLVFQRLGRIARIGDTVRIGPVTLRVESLRGHAIHRIRLGLTGRDGQRL